MMRPFTVEELADKFASKRGPIRLSPGRWYQVMRSMEEAHNEVKYAVRFEGMLDGPGWPFLFGRELQMKRPKKAIKRCPQPKPQTPHPTV